LGAIFTQTHLVTLSRAYVRRGNIRKNFDLFICHKHGQLRVAGLPDFPCYNLHKRGKIYQISIKYAQKLLNMPNGYEIYQMAIKYTNIFHRKTLQNLPKLELIGIFGLKTNHLATRLGAE
jgi:hypothetical protein